MDFTLTDGEYRELIEYYHIALTALAASPRVPRRYDRMCYAAREFANAHSGWTEGQAYKALERVLM